MSRLCECGCGDPTPLASRTRPELGHVKGEPIRFIRNHHRRGAGRSVEERFSAKVCRTDGCWYWTGALTSLGYGCMTIDARTEAVHRVAYQLLVGPIPEDMEIDHTCRVRRCVNPEHLRLATHAENAQNRETSAHRGAHFHKPTGRWRATAQVGAKRHYLGAFDTADEAARVAAEWRAAHMPFSSDASARLAGAPLLQKATP